jgi:hypothetical protein
LLSQKERKHRFFLDTHPFLGQLHRTWIPVAAKQGGIWVFGCLWGQDAADLAAEPFQTSKY